MQIVIISLFGFWMTYWLFWVYLFYRADSKKNDYEEEKDSV